MEMPFRSVVHRKPHCRWCSAHNDGNAICFFRRSLIGRSMTNVTTATSCEAARENQ